MTIQRWQVSVIHDNDDDNDVWEIRHYLPSSRPRERQRSQINANAHSFVSYYFNQEIVADIQKRMKNYDAWSSEERKTEFVDANTYTTSASTYYELSVDNDETTSTRRQSLPSTASSSSSSSTSLPSSSVDENENDVVLSLRNEYYKQIMWSHFRILGKDRNNDKERGVGKAVFDIFTKRQSLSRPHRGKFYKQHGGAGMTCKSYLEEVDDEAALASKSCV